MAKPRVMEGIVCVDKKVMAIARNPLKFRMSEQRAFEQAMAELWRKENGDARYTVERDEWCDKTLVSSKTKPWTFDTTKWHRQIIFREAR